jgi:hypothetical protein
MRRKVIELSYTLLPMNQAEWKQHVKSNSAVRSADMETHTTSPSLDSN